MTRRTPITLLVFALSLFISGCVHPSKAQIVNNVTPHNGQPVQTVITGTDPYGSCDNYAVLYINWMSGAQTACVKGTYQTSSLGGGGGMIYPQSGIAVSSGAGWAASKPAPNGDIVGTTDSQTLTNKFIDGVSPATMAYVDPTSSIQTQLNSKMSGLAIQQNGTNQGNVSAINCSTNLTCTVSGNTTTITASGSGGGTAGPYGYYAMTASGTGTQALGTDCSSSTPCSVNVGINNSAKLTSSVSFSVPSGGASNDTAYIYIDPSSRALTVGTQTLALTCSGCTAVTGITNFPFGSVPLYVATITGGNVASVVDDRAAFSVPVPLVAGNCIVLTPGNGSEQIAVDSSNSSCSGGGSSFNGGTITNPLVISNSGGGGDLLMTKITSSAGYNAIGLQDDLGNEWQVAVGGSTAGGLPKNSALYMYDKKNSNIFWYVDPSSDKITMASLAGNGTVLKLVSANTNAAEFVVSNTSTGGHTFHFSSSGSASTPGLFNLWDDQYNGSGGEVLTVDDTSAAGVVRTNSNSAFGWTNSATLSGGGSVDTKITRNNTGEIAVTNGSGTWGTVDVDNVKLGTDAPPACDSGHVGVINLDASKHLQICDGTAYHTITYTN